MSVFLNIMYSKFISTTFVGKLHFQLQFKIEKNQIDIYVIDLKFFDLALAFHSQNPFF